MLWYGAEKERPFVYHDVITHPVSSTQANPQTNKQWPKKEYYSPELKDFVAQCMMQNPQQRPSAEALLQHPFITKYASKDVDLAGWFKSVMGEKEKKEKSSKKNPPPPPKEHHPPPSASASPPVQPGA